MEINRAEQLNGRAWQYAKIAAFACFVLACGLLISSLLGPDAARAGLGAPADHFAVVLQPPEG